MLRWQKLLGGIENFNRFSIKSKNKKSIHFPMLSYLLSVWEIERGMKVKICLFYSAMVWPTLKRKRAGLNSSSSFFRQIKGELREENEEILMIYWELRGNRSIKKNHYKTNFFSPCYLYKSNSYLQYIGEITMVFFIHKITIVLYFQKDEPEVLKAERKKCWR